VKHLVEHYTDTVGFTDHVFGLMHLLGFRFAPRIRDLTDRRLYVPSETAAERSGVSGRPRRSAGHRHVASAYRPDKIQPVIPDASWRGIQYVIIQFILMEKRHKNIYRRHGYPKSSRTKLPAEHKNAKEIAEQWPDRRFRLILLT